WVGGDGRQGHLALGCPKCAPNKRSRSSRPSFAQDRRPLSRHFADTTPRARTFICFRQLLRSTFRTVRFAQLQGPMLPGCQNLGLAGSEIPAVVESRVLRLPVVGPPSRFQRSWKFVYPETQRLVRSDAGIVEASHMQYDVQTPQEYLSLLGNDWRREKLLELRQMIMASDPRLVEGIDYKMLSYRDEQGTGFALN